MQNGLQATGLPKNVLGTYVGRLQEGSGKLNLNLLSTIYQLIAPDYLLILLSLGFLTCGFLLFFPSVYLFISSERQATGLHATIQPHSASLDHRHTCLPAVLREVPGYEPTVFPMQVQFIPSAPAPGPWVSP